MLCKRVAVLGICFILAPPLSGASEAGEVSAAITRVAAVVSDGPVAPSNSSSSLRGNADGDSSAFMKKAAALCIAALSALTLIVIGLEKFMSKFTDLIHTYHKCSHTLHEDDPLDSSQPIAAGDVDEADGEKASELDSLRDALLRTAWSGTVTTRFGGTDHLLGLLSTEVDVDITVKVQFKANPGDFDLEFTAKPKAATVASLIGSAHEEYCFSSWELKPKREDKSEIAHFEIAGPAVEGLKKEKDRCTKMMRIEVVDSRLVKDATENKSIEIDLKFLISGESTKETRIELRKE